MSYSYPREVIISGGREVGGLESFAQSLATGFRKVGIPASVIPPMQIVRRLGLLRDEDKLKILSTTALFAVPFTRRSICVLHGFPRADAQGWLKLGALVAAYKLAGRYSGSGAVAVSHYTRIHVQTIFNVRCAAAIGNPVHPLFLEPFEEAHSERLYITYVGRMIRAKNVEILMAAVRKILESHRELRAVFIGDGPLRDQILAMSQGDPRIEVPGSLPLEAVRDYLRKTRVFVSGCETEALGIAYLEALSQGCTVAMPASGGGLEIAPELAGGQVQLFSPSLAIDSICASLERGLRSGPYAPLDMQEYSPATVARKYLEIDRLFMQHRGSVAASRSLQGVE